MGAHERASAAPDDVWPARPRRQDAWLQQLRTGVIRLRAWDEEVFLHECVHALCQAGELGLGDLHEEAVARQVSQGLYAMGWRYVGERPAASGAAPPGAVEYEEGP